MIFSSPLYGRVLAGRKTMTRRPVKPNDLETKYRPGMRRAVQKGRGQPGEAFVIFTGVRRERVGEITFEDARAEGFKTTCDFKRYWLELYSKSWIASLAETTELTDELVESYFASRHAHKQVWVITFDLDQSEHPRFLAERNVRADYVDSPVRSLNREPEAVDQKTQEKFSMEGFQGWASRDAQRELDRESLSADERLRQVTIDARAQGVDISHLEAQIMSRLRAAERKVHNRKAA